MPLVAAILASELEAMEPTDQEATAIDNFVTAWENYFSDASVTGIPTTPGSLAGAISAMRGALTGMSADGAGSAAIQAGITAFWGVVATAAPTIWATAPPNTGAVPPPGLSGIAAALDGVFASNTAGELELGPAATAVANAIHPTQLGGICNLPPAPTGPGPQPIL